MKIIFDFDDVLFDTKAFKDKIFIGLSKFNIDNKIIKNLYQGHRKIFNIKKFYEEAIGLSKVSVSEKEIEEVSNIVLRDLTGYADERLVNLMHGLGKENCFILSAGDEDFQRHKIHLSGVVDAVHDKQTIIVEDDKKEILRKICEEYSNESIIFIDDKERYIEDAVSIKMPNLFPVLYDENGFEALKEVIKFCNERDREVKSQNSRIPMR